MTSNADRLCNDPASSNPCAAYAVDPLRDQDIDYETADETGPVRCPRSRGGDS